MEVLVTVAGIRNSAMPSSQGSLIGVLLSVNSANLADETAQVAGMRVRALVWLAWC